MGSMRDAIRSATVGSANRFRSKLVTFRRTGEELVEVPNSDLQDGDLQIEIREPSVAARDALDAKVIARRKPEVAKAINDRKTRPGEAEGNLRAILQMIEMCYEPGTDTRIFEPEDFDSLMARSASGWINELAVHCLYMYLGVNREDLEKNSDGTTGDSTSSS